MADANTTVNVVVEKKLRQVSAILEAIFRMSKHPECEPETDITELSELASELVHDVQTELAATSAKGASNLAIRF